MSKHDHAEQLAQYEAAKREANEIANLIDYYTPLRPATVSPKSVAAVASAHQATSKQQGAIEHNGKR